MAGFVKIVVGGGKDLIWIQVVQECINVVVGIMLLSLGDLIKCNVIIRRLKKEKR